MSGATEGSRLLGDAKKKGDAETDVTSVEDPMGREEKERAKAATDNHALAEQHTQLAALLANIILGASDGLTVPFALAAGMSGAFANSRLVIVAVLSELAAGSISMGLGGYLSGRSNQVHYNAERRREEWEVRNMQHAEIEETYDIFRAYGLKDEQTKPICDHFTQNPEIWVDFMMKFELNLDKPDAVQPLRAAVAIGGSYLVAGFIPLFPYLFITNTGEALIWSAIMTVFALFTFGFVRSKILGDGKELMSALETTSVGIAAAASAYIIASYTASF